MLAPLTHPVFIELIDQLRCSNDHEDSWLVASAALTDGRDIVDGLLGCPVCRAEYPIIRGMAHFSEGPPMTDARAADENEALRLAAFLDLTDRRGYVVLIGEHGAHARHMQRLTEMHVLVVNPPPETDVGSGVSGLTTHGALPLAAGGAAGVALDAAATSDMVLSAVQTLRPGARLVGPVSVATPAGVTELARDEHIWVAKRTAAVPTRPLSIQANPARRR